MLLSNCDDCCDLGSSIPIYSYIFFDLCFICELIKVDLARVPITYIGYDVISAGLTNPLAVMYILISTYNIGPHLYV